MRPAERLGWLVVALVLATFAIPWFLWGSTSVVAGLPLWLWWHVGWMLLASLVFWIFTRRAWGIGIESDFGGDPTGSEGGLGPEGRPGSEATDGTAPGGERP